MKADVANVLTQLILTDSRENELVIKRERERERETNFPARTSQGISNLKEKSII
jgi:hypothetical protein